MMDNKDLKQFIIDIIEEEFSPKPIELAKRWNDGKLVLHPGNDSQPKEIPLDVFFKKLTGIRENLRLLEQKINNNEALAQDDKATLQSYLTRCYGSMTTFNVLFKNDRDKFVGSSGSDSDKSGSDDKTSGLSVGEARKRLGLNEYKKD